MLSSSFLRGCVYFCHIGQDEPKYLVIISDNARNRALGTALGCRITTTDKIARRGIPSIVQIPDGEPVSGNVICDDIIELWPEDVMRPCSGFSAPTMNLIDDGLRAALHL